MVKLLLVFSLVYANTPVVVPQTGLPNTKADSTQINRYLDKADAYFNWANFDKKILDSGYTYSNLALNLSSKIHDWEFQNRSMQRIGTYYHMSGHPDKAILVQKQIIVSYHQHAKPFQEADAWNKLADYYTDLNQVHFCCIQAQQIFQRSGRKAEAIGELKLWGDHLYRVMKLDSSAHVLKEVIRQYQAINYKKLQFTYDLLALTSFMKGDLKNNLAYRINVIKYMESTGDYSYAATYYYNLAYAYMLVHDYAQSIIYAQKSSDSQPHGYYSAIDLIISNMLALKKTNAALNYLNEFIKKYPPAGPEKDFDDRLVSSELSKIYTQLKRYKEAENILLKILPSYKLYDNPNKQLAARNMMIYVFQYENLANIYRLDGKFKEARYYLDKIPENFSKDLRPQNLIGLELLRFKVDSGFRNYVSAIRHYQLYKKLNDSIYSTKNVASINEVEARYQSEKKEHAIKLLESQQKLQALNMRSAVWQRNVTLAAIVVTLILTGLAYYAYRRKRISNLLINKKNNQLQILLTEKEWLLKEVHHRVKNNLHTVICLLESQSLYLQDDALKAIETSRHRIFSMSLIHQKLYQSDHIKVINIGLYIAEFVNYLEESFGSPEYVKIILDVEDIELGAAQAIPVGLIINEAVTNSYKYAFPKQLSGTITIVLKNQGDRVSLIIADNGSGFTPSANKETHSLGLDLIQGLTADLRGTVNIDTISGTSIQIDFKIDQFAIVENREQMIA